MRRMAGIWFIGAAAWTLSGLIALHRHAVLHARLSLTIALLFFAMGFFYRQQQ